MSNALLITSLQTPTAKQAHQIITAALQAANSREMQAASISGHRGDYSDVRAACASVQKLLFRGTARDLSEAAMVADRAAAGKWVCPVARGYAHAADTAAKLARMVGACD